VIDNWLNLVAACKQQGKEEGRPITIAVHCVAGLGRSASGWFSVLYSRRHPCSAPVLVAIALIEHGLDPLDAIQLIRSKRHGAMNPRQARSVFR